MTGPAARRILDALTRDWRPDRWSQHRTMLAVSGGSDSMALLRAMHTLGAEHGAKLAVAHFNHGFRGAESDADEALVRETCTGLEVPCFIGRLDETESPDTGRSGDDEGETASAEKDPPSEDFARRARYAFLEERAAEWGARYVVTAHTAEDQAETVLHHVLRGTGLTGLGGIARLRKMDAGYVLVRPLLEVRRQELRDYLAEIGQPFRDDASNDDSRYTRNRLRHQLLPTIAESFNPRVVEALARLGQQAREANEVIQAVVDRAWDLAAPRVSPEEVRISTHGLYGQADYVLRELCLRAWTLASWPRRHMAARHWQALVALFADAEASRDSANLPRRIMLPGSILAERSGSEVILRPVREPAEGS